MTRSPSNADIMRTVKDVQKTVNDMQPRVRSLEDWKIGLDAVAASRKPVFSLDGIDWKALIAITSVILAAIYSAIKQVK